MDPTSIGGARAAAAGADWGWGQQSRAPSLPKYSDEVMQGLPWCFLPT